MCTVLYCCTRYNVLRYCCSTGWMGAWVDRFVGVSIGWWGRVVFFFPPLYRPRAGIVRRTASIIIIMFKVL